jgi:YVTN family beta-propeller protein
MSSMRVCRFVLASVVIVCSDAVAADQAIKTIPVGHEPAFSVSSPDGAHVYVGNRWSADISVIDTQSDTVVATIPLQHNPGTLNAIHLSIAPDGTLIYAVDENIDAAGTVNVISTATSSVVATIVAGARPTDIVVRPDGAEVYVVNQNECFITAITTADRSVASVPVSDYPVHVAFSPDSRRAYVTRYGSAAAGGVTVLDTTSHAIVASIDDGGLDDFVFVSPDGAKLYVTYDNPSQDGRVVLRIIAADTTNDIYTVASDLVGPAASAWLALSADAQKAYLVSSVSPAAQIVDGAHNSIAGALQLPAASTYPVWSAADNHVYVPHTQMNAVSVIDAAVDAIVATYQTGNQPYYVTLAAGKKYVTNLVDGTVTVIGPKPNHPPVANVQTVSTSQTGSATIALTATDADLDPLSFSVTVQPMHGMLSGIAPNLTYTPALNYGGNDQFTFTANDGIADSNAAVVSIAVPFTTSTRVASSVNPATFGQAVTLTATVTSNGVVPTGTVQFFDGAVALGTSAVNAGTAVLTTSSVSAGARSITAAFTSATIGYAGSTSPALTQTISQATGTATLTVSALTPVYSDMETFHASFTPAVAGEPAPATVIFKIGSQEMGAATPTLVSGVYQYTLTAQMVEPYTTPPTRNMKPDFHVVGAFFTDPNFTVTNPTKAITIQAENARVAYTGPTAVSLGGASSGPVALTVTVKDITAVAGDPAWDPYPGDVRNAQVSFVDRSTNTILGTVSPTLSGSDPKVGTASFSWNVNLGTATSRSYTIGFIVGYYYRRNSTADNVVIVVSK